MTHITHTHIYGRTGTLNPDHLTLNLFFLSSYIPPLRSRADLFRKTTVILAYSPT